VHVDRFESRRDAYVDRPFPLQLQLQGDPVRRAT
jgi:hypothetical protein